jgi:TonB family protein
VDAVPSRNLTDSFPGGVSSGLSRRASTRNDADAPTPPRLIGTPPPPRYPELLRDLRLQGEVLVQFVVGENGVPDVGTMQVLRSPHAALTDAVRTALKQFRFEPARVGGRPRAETVKYGFTFNAPGR